jgi:hypothetical protein
VVDQKIVTCFNAKVASREREKSTESCIHVYIWFPGHASKLGPEEEEPSASTATSLGTGGRGVSVVTIRGSTCLTPAAPYLDTTNNAVIDILISKKKVSLVKK